MFSIQSTSSILIVLLLTVSLVISVDNAINDINSYLIKQHLNNWSEEGNVNKSDWQKVHAYYSNTGNSLISNPDTLSDRGRLSEWERFVNTERSNMKLEKSISADEYYIRSLKIRPLWPHTWKDLAINKANARNFDSIFQLAFKNAIELGSREKRILVELSEIGLRNWKQLTVDNRKLALQHIRRTATYRPHALTELTYNQNMLLILCNGVKNNPYIDNFCQVTQPVL